MFSNEDKTNQSFSYAKRQEELVTPEQRVVLDNILELLASWETFTLTTVTPVWYIFEGHGKKVQLEVDNPGANLDISEIEEGDEELKFPRRSFINNTVKLTEGNAEFAERKIISMFAKKRD